MNTIITYSQQVFLSFCSFRSNHFLTFHTCGIFVFAGVVTSLLILEMKMFSFYFLSRSEVFLLLKNEGNISFLFTFLGLHFSVLYLLRQICIWHRRLLVLHGIVWELTYANVCIQLRSILIHPYSRVGLNKSEVCACFMNEM